MNVHALGPWVLICPDPRPERVGSVLVAIETGAERVGYATGRVVDIAEHVYCDMADRESPVHSPDVCVGERVLYRRFLQYAHELEIDGALHAFIHWQDLLATLDEDTQLDLGGAV